MANVSVTISGLPESVRGFLGGLSGANARQIHSGAVEHVGNFVRTYLRQIAPMNHKTALSFTPPATPTGHLEKAARNTIWRAGMQGGTVTVTSPGIARAFHDLNIRAKSKMLTIPARPSPEAYGKRAREVAMTEALFLVKPKGGTAFLATRDGSSPSGPVRAKNGRIPRAERPERPRRERTDKRSEIRPVFWLRAAVTIPQKRDILPSDADLARQTKEGYKGAIIAWRELMGI